MKLDGVYYPLNDSISWLTTCMEEMKQDIARIQSTTDVARPTSIDNHLHTSIDSRLGTSIDNRIPASVDTNPPHPHSIKSQPDFHTRAEIDQIVEGIYRALESTEERLDGRCDDIYFPMDLSISALTSKIEAIQGELEISADTYARLMRHQFNLESLGDRLQKIEDICNYNNEGQMAQRR
ncbi:hypothetical protein DY000_02030905 [Brassica cretica]|uniref:Uncharacterized protein n=1 Tax=Brassica cretica TaxID=69181 RepID=A0ABQ7DII3_BRACR|nr:hypothetical protein DY000_02030905 [Brassica cretica]